jgi:hypothetical protein
MVSALKAGVTFHANAPVKRLIINDGFVAGLVFGEDAAEHTVRARGGVILATGGFGGNDEMRSKLIPNADFGWNLQPKGNKGDGIRIGIEAGGVIKTDNVANAIWNPSSAHRLANGRLSISVHALGDRYHAGTIMVDPVSGARILNEACSYQTLGQTMHARGMKRAWLISDASAARKHGLGLANPWPFSIKTWVKRGYLVEGWSIPELAEKIGVDARLLTKTVTEFNRNAEAGIDPDFQRGEDAYSRYFAGTEHQPNPSLGPLRAKPFYAVEIRVSEVSTLAGLETDSSARVLDRNGVPIPGLYAVGVDSNSMMCGTYPGAGCSLGPSMTFAYIVGRKVAEAIAGR